MGNLVGESKAVMDAATMQRALKRIAHEIVERNAGGQRLALIGIRRRGCPLADRLAQYIADIEGARVPVGILDINLYRDDLSQQTTAPQLRQTEVRFDVNGMNIVLVDDVAYTGRTVRAALDAIIDLGRPRSIQLAVLVDRGRRELPIKADYVGKDIPTTSREIISVRLQEIDGEDIVLLGQRPAES